MKNVLAVVLAGGKGTRLEPLTRDRAKPAVPFGGIYRIVDFALSNCVNSGIRKILVLTQYKAMSLDRHVSLGWRQLFCRELDEFIDVVPPQQRIDENWYQGTADAVYQNVYALEKEHPEYVVILSGDHIYKMNYQSMVQDHIDANADLTIGALPVRRDDARHFGVMQIDDVQQVVGFEEKPDDPQLIPGCNDECLASMGIYVFNARLLFELLCEDANLPHSAHDFGCDIIPSMIGRNAVFAYPFRDENRKSQAYWRDVGTLDAYYDANMDLVSVDPMLNLYDQNWPIRTHHVNLPPAKFVFASSQQFGRQGHALDSIVCPGAIVSGGRVERSVVGTGSRLDERCLVTDSVLLDRVQIGAGAIVRKTIIDKNVVIPANCQIGVNQEIDRQRGFTITPGGVTVIAKGDPLLESAEFPVTASIY